MSKVISKLRSYSPNKSNTVLGNIKHLYYISTRHNAIKNENGSSIFGYYGYNELENDIDKKEVAKYIKQIGNMKNPIYRGIISLKEEDAIKLGYDTREKWEDMLKESSQSIGEILRIPFSDMEYIGVVHLKKGNPHLHYMMWNKNTKIKNNFINIYQQNNVRDVLTKNIYKEELKELYDQRDIIKQDLRNKDLIDKMKQSDMENCDIKIPFAKMKNKKEIIKKFKEISKKLPKNGRLAYAYMDYELKCEIDSLSRDIIKSNYDMNQSYSNFKNKVSEIASYFSKGKAQFIRNSEHYKMQNILGNKLIKLMKEYKEITAEMLLFNLYKIMSQLEDRENSINNIDDYINSLSDNAKKEYVRKITYGTEEMER